MAYESGIKDADRELPKKQPKEYFAGKHPDMQEKKESSSFTFEDVGKIPACGSILSTACISGDTVFFGGLDKHFYALDMNTGKEKWKFIAGEIFSSATIYDDAAYFGSFDGCLYALSITNGTLLWKFRTGEKITCSPAVVDGVVYFVSGDGYAYALDAKTGQLKWKFYTGNPTLSEILVINDSVFFSSGYYFHCLNAEDGTEKWKYRGFDIGLGTAIAAEENGRLIWDFRTRSHKKMPATSDSKIYFGGRDGNLYCLGFDSKEKWKFLAGGGVWTPTVNDGIVFTGSNDFHIYAIYDGKLYWKFLTGSFVPACPVVDNDNVYFTSMDSFLYSFTTNGRALWKLQTGGAIFSSPVISGGVLFFGSADTYFYAVNAETKEVLWRFRTSMPTNIMGMEVAKELIAKTLDYDRRVFKIWTPETKAGLETLTQKTYKASSQDLTAPQTIYGTADPYKDKPAYSKEKTYEAPKKKKMPWEL